MNISDNMKRVNDIIAKKKDELGIKYPITIVGVTKTLPAEVVKEAVEAGISHIGESKIQEAESKFKELSGVKFTRHLIGHLQSNKANKAAELFDTIQSIDSVDLALKLQHKLSEINKVMPVLIEVNTSGEETKYGIDPDDLEKITGWILEMRNLKLKGLMTVGPLNKPDKEIHTSFATLFSLREKMEVTYTNLDLPVLSMGMSDDFEIAIEEGSTMLRLGRVLFGER